MIADLEDSRLPLRFWTKVVDSSNGCWVWAGYRCDDKARNKE